MPRYKKDPTEKLQVKSFSLSPEDLKKLDVLKSHYKVNNSKVIQKLVREEYTKIKESL